MQRKTRYERVREAVRDLCSSIYVYKFTHARALDRWYSYCKCDDFTKLTRIDQAYFKGWFDANFAILNSKMAFRYYLHGELVYAVFYDDRRVEAEKCMKLSHQELNANPDVVCAHFWDVDGKDLLWSELTYSNRPYVDTEVGRRQPKAPAGYFERCKAGEEL